LDKSHSNKSFSGKVCSFVWRRHERPYCSQIERRVKERWFAQKIAKILLFLIRMICTFLASLSRYPRAESPTLKRPVHQKITSQPAFLKAWRLSVVFSEGWKSKRSPKIILCFVLLLGHPKATHRCNCSQHDSWPGKN
jgi:hypothetical protein